MERCETGRWYLASYGFETVVGRCIADVGNRGVVLSFRWGNPWRTMQLVDRRRMIAEAPDPRWFGLRRLIFPHTGGNND